MTWLQVGILVFGWDAFGAQLPLPRKLLFLFLEERGERDDQETGLRARWDGYEPVKRASPIWRKYGRNGQLPDKKTRTRRA